MYIIILQKEFNETSFKHKEAGVAGYTTKYKISTKFFLFHECFSGSKKARSMHFFLFCDSTNYNYLLKFFGSSAEPRSQNTYIMTFGHIFAKFLQKEQ